MPFSKSVNVLVLRTAGTNCNEETAHAFEHFGAHVDQVHIGDLVTRARRLKDYHILALPGGFTYGDDIASGRILANELRINLAEDIRNFVSEGKLILGICNGFQILVKAGILPGPLVDKARQDVTLTRNDSAKFEARWVHLKSSGKSPWTEGLSSVMALPVAHGEGKFLPKDSEILKTLAARNQIVFRYCDAMGNSGEYPINPNGSTDDVAGICDSTGQVLGLMPHPERYFYFTQYPAWTRIQKETPYGQGAKIFENGMSYVREKLL
ncbi:MAG: phosphoribosylformylglycinamidine synthase I [Candidatus Omnitrophica bacterium]|nr:phosphoribosylformylglycinamidine synthase I [Candidatus Omnitrophota bacterium]